MRVYLSSFVVKVFCGTMESARSINCLDIANLIRSSSVSGGLLLKFRARFPVALAAFRVSDTKYKSACVPRFRRSPQWRHLQISTLLFSVLATAFAFQVPFYSSPSHAFHFRTDSVRKAIWVLMQTCVFGAVSKQEQGI